MRNQQGIPSKLHLILTREQTQARSDDAQSAFQRGWKSLLDKRPGPTAHEKAFHCLKTSLNHHGAIIPSSYSRL